MTFNFGNSSLLKKLYYNIIFISTSHCFGVRVNRIIKNKKIINCKNGSVKRNISLKDMSTYTSNIVVQLPTTFL